MAKKAKRSAPKKASTALAVRKPPVVKIQDPTGALNQALMPVGQLGELATVGALGLAEVKLTEAEERVLARPVDPSEIRVRDGGIAYLPHIVYTRWFNEAFGRTGWAIVPTSRPQKVGNLLLVPYLLYIHGVPVAAATGEHEYHETNARQTYGDVLESTVASALRRCAKRLGVGLEMWDPAWLERNAPGRGRKTVVREEFVDARPVPASEPVTINAEQRRRLIDVADRAGRPPSEVKLWLKARYGVSGTAEVKRADYAEICRQLEARGPLPMPGDGE